MSTRSYRQLCGLACSLDLLGERWTLLIVRELALGPRRYGDLAASLDGIGTNLLAARLRSLDEAGVVRKVVLPPPANVAAYELTARGEELRPMLKALALWGFALLPDRLDDSTARASWAAMSMGAVADQHDHDVTGTYAFDVTGERFWVALGDHAEVRLGIPPTPPAATLVTDLPTFFALASGRLEVADAVERGAARTEGDPDALERLLTVFHLPAAVPSTA